MPAPVINLCELKQTHKRTTGKESNCSEVDIHELTSDNVCPDCSIEIFKLEKKYQVVERLQEEGYGDRIKPVSPLSTTEYLMWKFWRADREKFRQLGVWGGDENGEIGQGAWSLAGWDGHSPFHPSKPGARSLRTEGGGFNSAFRWDPFLGRLSDVRMPDDSGIGKGMHKLMGKDNPHVRDQEQQLESYLLKIGFVDGTEEGTGRDVGRKSEVEDEGKKIKYIIVAL